MASVIEDKLTAATGTSSVNDAVHNLSERLLSGCVGDNSRTCLRSLSNKLGVVSITLEDLPCEALLVPLDTGRYKIMLSMRANRHRRRFSLAHELGHIMLHQVLPETRDFETRDVFMPPGNQTEEDICDRFAAEILMPRLQFEAELSNRELSICTIQHLSQRFDVSLSAATNRCKELLNVDLALAKFDSCNQSMYMTQVFVNFEKSRIYRDRRFSYPFSSIPGIALFSKALTSGWVWIQERWNKRRLFCSAMPSSNEESILTLLLRCPTETRCVHPAFVEQFEDGHEEAFT